MDYFHIDHTDFLQIRCVNYADSLGIRHGMIKKGIICTISVVYRRQNNSMGMYMNIHQAKDQCFNGKGKFLFILFITLTILVTKIFTKLKNNN